MMQQNITYHLFLIALCTTIPCIPRIRHKPTPKKTFTPTMDNLNVMTLRPYQKGAKHVPECDLPTLVKKIHHGKHPPITRVIPGEKDASYCFLYQPGIATTDNDPIIFLFSRGYAKTSKPGTNGNFIRKGACAVGAYVQLTHHIINNAPCVSFDYPDEKRWFNFGQKTDQECLEFVYHKVRNQSPHAHIVLVGDCRGARTALKFALHNPEKLKAVILMSPFVTTRTLTSSTAKHHLRWLPRSSNMLHTFFQWWFPNYKPHEDWTLETLPISASTPPVLIGHRIGDTLTPDDDIERLVSHLRSDGNPHIYFLPIRDKTELHSKLPSVTFFQRGANAFLKEHDLPHHSRLTTPHKPLIDLMKSDISCDMAPTPLAMVRRHIISIVC